MYSKLLNQPAADTAAAVDAAAPDDADFTLDAQSSNSFISTA